MAFPSAREPMKVGGQLTDRSLVGSWIVDFVVADSLGAIHGLVEHGELHLLLLGNFLLEDGVLAILLLLVLRVLEVARHAERGVLVLDHGGARLILAVTLLLVSLNGNVSIDRVKVFFLFCKHLRVGRFSKSKMLLISFIIRMT